jgi:DNA repair exonuclease SbcCD ATPase subunit
MKIERITVQAFRGYPGRADVVLGGDVVLLSGENGTGKTSLTEAFEWVLFGTIVRKARSKTPGEYRGWGWVRSVHANRGLPTFAEVELVTGKGRRHIIRRELSGNSYELTIDGQAAEDITRLGLRIEDAFRPFLGQCEIQALIDSEQQDRWEQLSAILGFGSFGQARQRLQRMRTDANHDVRVERTREIAQRTVQPLTAEGEDSLAQNPVALRERAARYLELPDDALWADIKATSDRQLEALYSRDRPPSGLSQLLTGRDQLRSAVTTLNVASDELLGQVEAHRRWHVENTRSVFAEQGLLLVDDDHPDLCPFCAETTLSAARIDELRDVSEESPTKPADHRGEFQQAIADLTQNGPVNPTILAGLVTSLNDDAPERDVLDQVRREYHRVVELQGRLGGFAEGFLAATESASRPSGNAAQLGRLAEELRATARELSDVYAATRVSAENVISSLTRRFTALNEDDQRRVSALQAAKVLAENARAVEAAWRVRALQESLADLVGGLEAAEKQRMGDALETLSTDTGRYYEELSPGHHIKITGVRVRDSKRRQASLEATSHGKRVNPVTMFSEAEGNCLGLSLYFSQRVDRNPGWSMIMLDDPVQSMDEGHEEGLINLLTRISRDRQVIVMTHARRFAKQVDLQFSGLPTYTRYNFERGSGPEPQIEIAAGRLNDLLVFAEKNASGGQVLRESCAGAIRKGVERFCRDLGAEHGLSLKQGSVQINTLVDPLEANGLVDELEAGTLRRLGRFGSRASHEDEHVNPSESSILANSRALRELQAKRLAGGRPALTVVDGGRKQRDSA